MLTTSIVNVCDEREWCMDYGLRNSELSTCLFQFSHKTRQTMLLYAYFTPKSTLNANLTTTNRFFTNDDRQRGRFKNFESDHQSNWISNRTYDSKSNRITKLRRSLTISLIFFIKTNTYQWQMTETVQSCSWDNWAQLICQETWQATMTTQSMVQISRLQTADNSRQLQSHQFLVQNKPSHISGAMCLQSTATNSPAILPVKFSLYWHLLFSGHVLLKDYVLLLFTFKCTLISESDILFAQFIYYI